jgi:hypothetical protein
MLKLSDIRLAERCDPAALRLVAAEVLGVPESMIREIGIHKLSIDARRKPDVRFVYTLLVSLCDEQAVLSRNPENVTPYIPPERYVFPFPPAGVVAAKFPPVVVGTGPAGLFAAMCLAEAGVRCVVLERGRAAEQRFEDVMRFWRGGELDISSVWRGRRGYVFRWQADDRCK